MGSEKIFIGIVIVFLLVTIYQGKMAKPAVTPEKMYAANWVGQPGADSVHRAAPLLVRVQQ